MKREIKFRGKRPDNGEWILGYLFQDDDDHFPEIHACGTLDNWEQVREATVGQYTGLKDRNGEEIYEGDVLEIEKERYCVEYNPSRAMFVAIPYDSNGRPTFVQRELNIPLLMDHDTKLLGNIHDNPELMTA